MKTKELLDKYCTILSSILKSDPKDIKFFIQQQTGLFSEIREIVYFEPEKDKDGNETGENIRHTYWKSWSEGVYKVTYKDILLSTFELYKMPHCCAILVSCKAFVSEEFRGKRIGTIMNNLRQDLGRILGYSLLFCTDIEKNENQRKLLKTNGWKDIHNIINKRTNNRVYLSVINL